MFPFFGLAYAVVGIAAVAPGVKRLVMLIPVEKFLDSLTAKKKLDNINKRVELGLNPTADITETAIGLRRYDLRQAGIPAEMADASGEFIFSEDEYARVMSWLVNESISKGYDWEGSISFQRLIANTDPAAVNAIRAFMADVGCFSPDIKPILEVGLRRLSDPTLCMLTAG